MIHRLIQRGSLNPLAFFTLQLTVKRFSLSVELEL